jgi:hypothetical protein
MGVDRISALLHSYFSPDIRVNKTKGIKRGRRVAGTERTEIRTES